MPIYEYRCGACGFQKEYLQRISDALLTDCPQCGKGTLSKMVTAAGFQLKGSGWYATDFKTKSSPKPKTDEVKSVDAPKKEESKKEESKKDESKAAAAGGDRVSSACN